MTTIDKTPPPFSIGRKRLFPWLAFLCLLSGQSAQAQLMHGRITDTENRVIPYAAVYIREIALGIVSDEDGKFQTELAEGSYTCEISSLGFSKKVETIEIGPADADIHFELAEKTYSLKEVSVSPGKEDPAYRIMRKVVAYAPYHLHQIKGYEANVYMKGTFKVEKVPTLVKSQIDKEYRDMIGKLFVAESESQVKFTEPDKYEEHIIAFKSSIPKNWGFEDIMPEKMIAFNIYQSELLGHNTFSIYRFQLDDVYQESGHLINKIKVTPKKNSKQYVNGYLYIIDGQWTITRANLSMSAMGITFDYNLTYSEVKEKAFLLTAYTFSAKLDALGAKGFGKFYTSIQYGKLETNQKPIAANTDAEKKETPNHKNVIPTKKQQKKAKEMEELMNKDKLTTREAYKLSKLVQETSESEEAKAKRQDLHLQRSDSLFTITHDSLAFMRDSSFWAHARNLPLTAEELQSYISRDSLKTIQDSLRKADSLENRTATTWIRKIISGESIKFSGKHHLKYGGIIQACPEYNFVDGFLLGQNFEFGLKLRNNNQLTISPSTYYTTARHHWLWKAGAELAYARMRRGELSVSIGDITADYAGELGANRVLNSLSSLFLAKNPAVFYSKRFINLSNQIDLANGLVLKTGMDFEKRRALCNNTSYSFFGRMPRLNIPNGHPYPMPDHEAFTAEISLSHTPRYYYRINTESGRKEYAYSRFPTFVLSYKKAFGGGNGDNPSYNLLQAQITQGISTGAFSRFVYGINTGKFFQNKCSYLPDYKHFATSEYFATSKSLFSSFSLMDYYVHATNDKWLQAHLAYYSSYLFLKNLPFLQKYFFDEALHLHSLWIPGCNHNEIGYSIGLGNIGRIGVFAGFSELKYENAGITLSLPMFKL